MLCRLFTRQIHSKDLFLLCVRVHSVNPILTRSYRSPGLEFLTFSCSSRACEFNFYTRMPHEKGPFVLLPALVIFITFVILPTGFELNRNLCVLYTRHQKIIPFADFKSVDRYDVWLTQTKYDYIHFTFYERKKHYFVYGILYTFHKNMMWWWLMLSSDSFSFSIHFGTCNT